MSADMSYCLKSPYFHRLVYSSADVLMELNMGGAVIPVNQTATTEQFTERTFE